MTLVKWQMGVRTGLKKERIKWVQGLQDLMGIKKKKSDWTSLQKKAKIQFLLNFIIVFRILIWNLTIY